MAASMSPDRIAEWLGSMASCVPMQSLNKIKQQVLARRVSGHEFSCLVNECKISDLGAEDLSGRDAARLRKAWHVDFPDSVNLHGQAPPEQRMPSPQGYGQQMPGRQSSGAAERPDARLMLSSAQGHTWGGPGGGDPNPRGGGQDLRSSQDLRNSQEWRPASPPGGGGNRQRCMQQGGPQSRSRLNVPGPMEGGHNLFVPPPRSTSPAPPQGAHIIALLIDRLARWAGFDRVDGFEEVRDMLPEAMQEELRCSFVTRGQQSPSRGAGLGNNALVMELERVKAEAAADRARTMQATQQADFDRMQAQAEMQQVQLELERLQTQASSQAARAEMSIQHAEFERMQAQAAAQAAQSEASMKQVELERLHATSQNAQAHNAAQQAQASAHQAQTQLAEKQMELQRMQARARDNMFGSGPSGLPSSPASERTTNLELERQEMMLQEQQRQLEMQRRQLAQEQTFSSAQQQLEDRQRKLHETQRQVSEQRQQLQDEINQNEVDLHRRRQDDADAGRAGWAVVEDVYDDPASAAAAAVANRPAAARQRAPEPEDDGDFPNVCVAPKPRQQRPEPPARQDSRPIRAPENNNSQENDSDFPDVCMAPPRRPPGGGQQAPAPRQSNTRPTPAPIEIAGSGRTPSEIAHWVRNLPESQVPEAQREALADTVERQAISGTTFSELAGKSTALIEYGLASPQQALKVRRAWDQVLREDECKKVAIENAHGPSIREKAVKMLL